MAVDPRPNTHLIYIVDNLENAIYRYDFTNLPPSIERFAGAVNPSNAFDMTSSGAISDLLTKGMKVPDQTHSSYK